MDSVLIQITNASQSATDLGFLLHKNPANLHSVEVSGGKAHVFYTARTADRCTACVLLELDPVELVRGAQQLDAYVNDRPYVVSSYMSVAIARLFGTALAGNCAKRPDLVSTALPLTITIPVLSVRGGAGLVERLFEPLGYKVEPSSIPLDETFPEWGVSRYVRASISATMTVQNALAHLYVLLPVMDDDKHYYVGEAEVEKLLRKGEGWLNSHPERQVIVSRYLKRRSTLIDQAFEQLLNEENAAVEAAEESTERAAQSEQNLERPMTLHTQRLNVVATRLKELGAKSVVDMGCGEGKLMRRLLADRTFERICGMDVSHRSLEIASARLRLDRMPERQKRRVQLMQGSLSYRDQRLNGFDAAALVEVIEHLDPHRLEALARSVFEFARPRHVVITTPNREYNALFPTLPVGKMRHNDHRFEWTRKEFTDWATATASRFGYAMAIEPVGPEDATLGAPSQMAVFTLAGVAAA